MSVFYRPGLLYMDGRFVTDTGLEVDGSGRIEAIAAEPSGAASEVVALPGRALVPGFVNSHSHSFQRLIRGKAESRVTSGKDFWSWRGTMYHAALQLEPDEVYDVARMAFLEMLAAGTTTVGEFHYLHRGQDARPYSDPNLLGRKIIAAAESVGIRIVLLRSAYLRAGFELPPDPGQSRFYETSKEFLANTEELLDSVLSATGLVSVGVAPHSIRAVPLEELQQIAGWARVKGLPVHMHVAEQIAENEACVREYGFTPVELLSRNGLLGTDFTAVHAIHLRPDEIAYFAASGATVCSCPTTERNLGDGIVAAADMMRSRVRITLGSDSQAQIDPLEDARELDYHLRLRDQQRAILDQIEGRPIAERLMECATVNGARALSVAAGEFAVGRFADGFTVDLNDLSIAGNSAEDLLPIVVFGMNRTALRDVMVGGRMVLQDGSHSLEEEIVARYAEVHRKVWGARR